MILVLLLVLYLWRKHYFAIFALMIICLGVGTSLISANNLDNNTQNILKMEAGTYIFNAEEDQKVGTYYNSCEAKIHNTNYKVKLQLPEDFEEVHAGDIIKATVKFSKAADTQASNY